jgi:hypothetical protein
MTREAQMSQVSFSFHKAEPLSQTISRLSANDHIVIVRGPITSKIYLNVIFPKKNHFKKAEETTYEEFVYKYAVIDIIKSKSFKTGDLFWVWKKPYYTQKNIKTYHEIGLLCSPDILKREPNYPLEGDHHIAFVRKMNSKSSKEFPDVFSIQAEEGMDAEPEIRELIKAKKKEGSRE